MYGSKLHTEFRCALGSFLVYLLFKCINNSCKHQLWGTTLAWSTCLCENIIYWVMLNVLYFKISNTYFPAKKGCAEQCRPRSNCFILIRDFPVCYSNKHFVNSSSKRQHFIWEQRQKSVQNFRTLNFTINHSCLKQGSYRQVWVIFKDFSKTSKSLSNSSQGLKVNEKYWSKC